MASMHLASAPMKPKYMRCLKTKKLSDFSVAQKDGMMKNARFPKKMSLKLNKHFARLFSVLMALHMPS